MMMMMAGDGNGAIYDHSAARVPSLSPRDCGVTGGGGGGSSAGTFVFQCLH